MKERHKTLQKHYKFKFENVFNANILIFVVKSVNFNLSFPNFQARVGMA